MQNRTIGIVATVIAALVCGCSSLFSCVWGVLIATGTPINVTANGTTTPQTFSPTIGYTLLCLSLLLIMACVPQLAAPSIPTMDPGAANTFIAQTVIANPAGFELMPLAIFVNWHRQTGS